MYRVCPDCNNGQGLRLGPQEVSCPEDHDTVICLLEVGDTVGDFLIEAVLPAGEGGFSTVYCAKPKVEGYPEVVALKLASALRRSALEHEANTLSHLGQATSRHLLKIYGISPAYQAPSVNGAPGVTNEYVGRAVVDLEPFYYLALEYLPAGSLRDLLDRKKGRGLGLEQSLRIIHQVGEALDIIHSHGMIHLDVKPSNIMFDPQGEAVLIDFGIAVLQHGEETSWAGTAPYAPREQINQEYPDHRADIHALAVTLYEMLSGRLPYNGTSATALATAVRVSRPMPLGKVDRKLAYLEEVVGRGMEPDPTARYSMVSEFLRALDAAVARNNKGRKIVAAAVATSLPSSASPSLAPTYASSTRTAAKRPVGARLGVVMAALVFLAPTSWAVARVVNGQPILGASSGPPAPQTIPVSTVLPDQPPAGSVELFPTETPGSAGLASGADSLLPAVQLVQPAPDTIFRGPGATARLTWTDPSGPLTDGQEYVIDILLPDKTVFSPVTKDSAYTVPASKYNPAARSFFRWRVYRASGQSDQPSRISAFSELRSFAWLAPDVTPLPTDTPSPTSVATPTTLPSVTPSVDSPSGAGSPVPPTATRPPRLTPTWTPQRPTRTPVRRIPTSTPVPTWTPVPTTPPTNTPVPTATPIPTDTAVPTNTPVPPTNTRVPTDTRVPPTSTPVPSNTPKQEKPTKTPVPPPPVGTRSVILPAATPQR